VGRAPSPAARPPGRACSSAAGAGRGVRRGPGGPPYTDAVIFNEAHTCGRLEERIRLALFFLLLVFFIVVIAIALAVFPPHKLVAWMEKGKKR
jgi:hypothetical protein